MKKTIINILIAICMTIAVMHFASCGTNRPCGDYRNVLKHDQRPFRVHRINKMKNGTYMVMARSTWGAPSQRQEIRLNYECIPDSICKGSIINL